MRQPKVTVQAPILVEELPESDICLVFAYANPLRPSGRGLVPCSLNFRELDMMKPLRDLLSTIPPGDMSDGDCLRIVAELSQCWDSIPGSDVESTTADKLRRIEDVYWNPPILSFALERHGGTVLGSSRASLHRWEVDIEQPQARIVKTSVRQLSPKAEVMDIEKKANVIATLILNGVDDPRIAWLEDRQRVQVNIGEVIQQTNPQTTQGRRKRFRVILASLMSKANWTRQDVGNKIGFRRP